MLTNRQVMQIKRSIGNKHGFTRDSVDITDIRNVPKNIVIDGGRIEIEVDFSHPSGFWASEIFILLKSFLSLLYLYVAILQFNPKYFATADVITDCGDGKPADVIIPPFIRTFISFRLS